MTKTKRRQLSAKVHELFQLLLEHPEGLSTKDMWSQLEAAHNGNGANRNGANGNSANGLNGANGFTPSFEEFSFFCVGAIKAGWLVVERNHWSVSSEGKAAFANYGDAEQFITEAGKRST